MKTLSKKNTKKNTKKYTKKYTKKNTKKYTKKGGIFFTKTSKYKDIKGQRLELEETVRGLEEELRRCRVEADECWQKVGETQFRKVSGGMFGLTSSSKYHEVKSEKERLEQRIIELTQAIEACKQENQKCKDKHFEVRSQKWNKSMASVIARSAKKTEEVRPLEEERQKKEVSNDPECIPEPTESQINAAKKFIQSEHNRTWNKDTQSSTGPIWEAKFKRYPKYPCVPKWYASGGKTKRSNKKINT